MFCRVRKKDFFPLLKKGEKVIDTRIANPVYQASLIEFNEEDYQIRVITTNSVMSFYAVFRCYEVRGSGAICVPCKKLYEVVKSFSDEEEIELTVEERRLRITDRNQSVLFELPYSGKEEFPLFKIRDPLLEIRLNASSFYRLLEKTHYASSDSDNYVLSGVYVEFLNGDGIRAVASDGYRLALYDGKRMKCEGNWACIIPKRAVEWLLDHIDEEEEEIVVRSDGKLVAFEMRDCTLVSSIVEGQFPDYRAVLPEGNEWRSVVKVGRKALLDSLKRVLVMEKGERIKPVKFDISLFEIVLENASEAQERARMRLPVVLNGEANRVILNGDFLIDALEIMSGEQVEMRVGDSGKPVLILDGGDEAYLYLVMPIVL